MMMKVTVATAIICILMPQRALGRKSPLSGQSPDRRGMHGRGGVPTYGFVKVGVAGWMDGEV